MQVQDVVTQLQQQLDEGSLARGGRLPPERELAVRLKTSRGTLRKALEALESEGRIWRHVGQGTFVGPRGGDADLGLGDAINRTNPAEVMEVRLILEPRIAAAAALRATPAELREMELAAMRGGAASDTPGFERWDGRLHRLIALSARNALLLTLFDVVNGARESELWGRLKAASLTADRRRAYTRQHGRIVSAIRDRDTEGAARKMRQHLETVQRDLLG